MRRHISSVFHYKFTRIRLFFAELWSHKLDDQHVKPFKTKGKEKDRRKKIARGCSEKHYIYLEWVEKFTTLKLPRHCLLVRLAMVGWRTGLRPKINSYHMSRFSSYHKEDTVCFYCTDKSVNAVSGYNYCLL